MKTILITLSFLLVAIMSFAQTPSEGDNDNIPTVDLAKANKVSVYKAGIWNTVFSVPIARVNVVENEALTKAHLSLFSSVGAGFGFSSGRWTITRNNEGRIINQEFSNTVGLHLGLLYSSETGEQNRNIVAPVLNLDILDFQVGIGYEAGTITENQNRVFFTISYAIPVYKLVNTNFRTWLRSNDAIDEYDN